jgi:chemotaxis protein histidine kinase CheA
VSQAKFTPWKSRLSKIIKQSGGKTVKVALTEAGQNVQKIKPECIAEIDAKLGLMLQRCGHLQTRPDDGTLDEIYRYANDIVGMAGLFDLAELGEAAFSLCELIDRLKGVEQWDGPAVEVHLASLMLLRRATPGAPENRDVLAGLRKLTARVEARRELKKA